MALSRKPSLGARPSGPSCMHIVPPVPMIKTRDSGRPALRGGEFVIEGDMCGALNLDFCFEEQTMNELVLRKKRINSKDDEVTI